MFPKISNQTRNEDGCVEYIMYQDNDFPEVFVFYEILKSAVHLKKQMNSDHCRSCFSTLEGIVEEISLHKLTCIA